MRPFGPTPAPRLNEASAIAFLFGAIILALSLVSYHPSDPSWNTSAGSSEPSNLVGAVGSHTADLCLQVLGLASFLLPIFVVWLAWKWLRSKPISAQFAKMIGFPLLLLSTLTALGLVPGWRPFDGAIAPGGVAGLLLAEYVTSILNFTGAVLLTATCWIISVYLVSSFSMFRVPDWLGGLAGAGAALGGWWRGRKALRRGSREGLETIEKRAEARARRMAQYIGGAAPRAVEAEEPLVEDSEIPIRTLEDIPAQAAPDLDAVEEAETPKDGQGSRMAAPFSPPAVPQHTEFRLPSTGLLNEPPGRSSYDEQHLKDIAVAVKAKFEEFSVFGTVVQINPGPVVTTFEFKPEAGIKYSRITTLSEDLCLGLQAESILIERIPGRPTVGIEVPNTKRELISLREILESEELDGSQSRLTFSLGKDINGRIKVAALESMPHLLIAGSTGSGKSVMLHSLIMQMLFKATPEEVRLLVVDPKRVELGAYEGIPHLLTPVITDPRMATNALRNAVLEMDHRLRLLAAQGVRNIEQYNRKVRQALKQPRRLFEEDDPSEALEPLPYILIVIDELADLMVLERGNVEAAVTRLAQMARAAGMHLVLATQRPSVDVITGLIKANFPARISFRVATRVDSRTVLDVMGAEHLLGRGDMLFLPPASSRLTRVHGAFVTENEISRVVEFWKQQAGPDYDESFLTAPPSEEDEDASDSDGFAGADDPAYEDAVRVVVEMGKASTSTLQRRLRLGYGRAARLLDIMQKDGIISPPDGSKPREVLKAPDWLAEVEQSVR